MDEMTNCNRPTLDHVMSIILSFFPEALISEGLGGEIIVETGLAVDGDGFLYPVNSGFE